MCGCSNAGTLTRNVMEFFKCSVAGVSYGNGVTEIERSAARRIGHPVRITHSLLCQPLGDQQRVAACWMQHVAALQCPG